MFYNDKQQEIVNYIDGPLLCVAGPGSGKTTCMIGRVNNMVHSGINPNQILVVTFTKAAADEMKERYLAMENSVEGPFFGTIHSLCFRILRKYAPDKYGRDSVLTEQDQRVFIRNQIKSLRIERIDQDAIINSITAAISNVKNNDLNPRLMEVDGCSTEQFYNIFTQYENFKKQENKIDYDDMLFITDKILADDPATLSFWRNTFSHIIVDEFQDTNILQSRILYNIAYPKNNICVVGDDDQCQPAGTQILMKNGTCKAIENIAVGDEIAFYDTYYEMCRLKPKFGNPFKSKVEEIATREVVNEDIIEITTDKGNKSRYTRNHRTFVKCNFPADKFVVSIARCPVTNKCVLDVSRLNQEEFHITAPWEFKADKRHCNEIWLLKIFDSKEIADETFKLVQDMLKIDGDEFTDNGENLTKVLSSFNKDIRYPFFSREYNWLSQNLFTANDECLIFASNIFPEFMSAIVYDVNAEDNKRYEKIVSVKYEYQNKPCKVYSLKTTMKTYIADGIATHNCIYKFRGAVPQIMLDFEKQFEGCKKVILNVNHRSEPDIVATSKRLIEKNKVRFDKPLAAHKTGESVITYTAYKNRDKEIASIVKDIKYKQRKGESLDDIAILYRTNNQAAQITQAMIKADIPFYTNEMVVNIYDHWIFNDFKNFKKVVDGTCTINEFLSIINRPNKYISRKILPETYSEEEIMKSVFKISESWKRDKMRETLDDWFFWIDKMSEMTPYQFISCIRKNLEYDKYVKTYAETNKFDESQFVDVMDEIQDAAESFSTFEEWNTYIEKELRDFREKMKEKKKEGSVALSTMHKAKGLEWKEVYIVDCNESITPYYKAEMSEDIEEERRMFYVAVTRAKEILHICHIEKRNKAPMYVSRFVKEMQPEVVKHTADQGLKTATATIEFKPQSWVFHKTFGRGMVTKVDSKMVYIAFADAGMKTLDKDWCMANLQLF